MTTQRPEGWYPNPAGPGNRWWDGNRWTEFTDPPPGPPVAPAPYGSAPGYGQPQFGQTYGQPQYAQPAYGYPAQAATRFGVPFAGFWQRVAASIIDGLIVGIPLLIIGVVLFWADISEFFTTISENPEANVVPSDSLITRVIVYFVFAAIVGAAYSILLIANRGATVGMSALGIHVVDAQGSKPSLGRSAGRWGFTQAFSFATSFVPFVGGFVGLLDPLWMLWEPEKQTLHDKVAKTWVLKRMR